MLGRAAQSPIVNLVGTVAHFTYCSTHPYGIGEEVTADPTAASDRTCKGKPASQQRHSSIMDVFHAACTAGKFTATSNQQTCTTYKTCQAGTRITVCGR